MKIGTIVRFTKGPLGAIREGSSRFADIIIEKGDTGVLMDAPNDIGRVNVLVERDGQRFIVPLHFEWIEDAEDRTISLHDDIPEA